MHIGAVYAVLRTADVGESEVFAVLTDEHEADRLANRLNRRDGSSYYSSVTYEPIYATARDAWTDLIDDEYPETLDFSGT